jgi:hypothetical protein
MYKITITVTQNSHGRRKLTITGSVDQSNVLKTAIAAIK